MFTKSARFYDALYHFKDYPAASRQLHALIQQRNRHAQSLLDVACGTGQHLASLKDYYSVEGVDINAEMLDIARARCPDTPFHQADMTDFRLDRVFDVVTCLFSSIGYVKTATNLRRAVAVMASHVSPGGLLVLEPWLTPESYWLGRITANFADAPDLKIAWMYTSEREGDISIFDISYLVGTPTGVTHFTERHEMGLFAHEQYLEAFQAAGLAVEYDPKGLFGRGMYLGTANQA